MHKVLYTCAFFLFFLIFLAGCSSTSSNIQVGISKAEWDNTAKDERKAILSYYKALSKKYKKYISSQQSQPHDLAIKIYDGSVFMPQIETWHDYKPIDFVISDKECVRTELQHKSNKKYKTELDMCFYKNALRIDPSRYDKSRQNGTVVINFSPLWSTEKTGFVYKNIDSDGYARLKNVTIEIKQKSQ